jgi:hypothetical protein
MPQTLSDLIDSLNTIQGQLVQASATLSDQGNTTDASKINACADILSELLLNAESKALDQWNSQATDLSKSVTDLNIALQKQIAGISDDIALAQNIVGALSAVDQVINKAKGLLG